MEVHIGYHDLFCLFVDLHNVERLAERRHDARGVTDADKSCKTVEKEKILHAKSRNTCLLEMVVPKN